MAFKDFFKYLKNYPQGFVSSKPNRREFYVNAVDIAEAEPGDMIKVVPVGVFPMHHNGGHEVTVDHVQQMAKNFEKSGTDLLFDYDHSSMLGQSRAAGWSDTVEAREDGLYARYPEFTSAAQELIDDREFRYFSPVYTLESTSKEGKRLGAQIKSVAITNIPYFDTEIDPIGNSTAGGPKSPESEKTDPIDMKLNAESLKKLGLTEAATEEQVNNAIINMNEKSDEDTSSNHDRKSEDDETDAAPAAINKELQDKVNSLTKRLDDREKADKEERISTLVNNAIADGKVNPADADFFINAAKADFKSTKEKLEQRKANSVMPGAVTVGNPSTAANEEDASTAFRNAVEEKSPELARR